MLRQSVRRARPLHSVWWAGHASLYLISSMLLSTSIKKDSHVSPRLTNACIHSIIKIISNF